MRQAFLLMAHNYDLPVPKPGTSNGIVLSRTAVFRPMLNKTLTKSTQLIILVLYLYTF